MRKGGSNMELFSRNHLLGTIEASSQDDVFRALAARAVELGAARSAVPTGLVAALRVDAVALWHAAVVLAGPRVVVLA